VIRYNKYGYCTKGDNMGILILIALAGAVGFYFGYKTGKGKVAAPVTPATPAASSSSVKKP
jgi:hypothetical protein